VRVCVCVCVRAVRGEMRKRVGRVPPDRPLNGVSERMQTDELKSRPLPVLSPCLYSRDTFPSSHAPPVVKFQSSLFHPAVDPVCACLHREDLMFLCASHSVFFYSLHMLTGWRCHQLSWRQVTTELNLSAEFRTWRSPWVTGGASVGIGSNGSGGERSESNRDEDGASGSLQPGVKRAAANAGDWLWHVLAVVSDRLQFSKGRTSKCEVPEKQQGGLQEARELKGHCPCRGHNGGISPIF
jgi:hypothetical protein